MTAQVRHRAATRIRQRLNRARRREVRGAKRVTRRRARTRVSHAERHAQLIDVAEQLFIDRGYARVSMEDIARVAGVTRPVVYNHFETKEGTYLACVERAGAAYEQELMESVDPSAAPREQLAQGGEAFFSMLERNPGRWKLLFASNSVLPGDYDEELHELRMRTIRVIHAQLKASVPDAPELGAEAAAHAISGVGERLGHWWLMRPDLTRQEVVGLYVRFICDGVGP